MVAIGDLMFFRSHTLTVRSSLPDTTLSPTVKTADVTVLQQKQVNDQSQMCKSAEPLPIYTTNRGDLERATLMRQLIYVRASVGPASIHRRRYCTY